MFLIFIVDGNFERVYICLKEKYVDVVQSLGIHSNRVRAVNVSMEALTMLLDKQMHHIMLYK